MKVAPTKLSKVYNEDSRLKRLSFSFAIQVGEMQLYFIEFKFNENQGFTLKILYSPNRTLRLNQISIIAESHLARF